MNKILKFEFTNHGRKNVAVSIGPEFGKKGVWSKKVFLPFFVMKIVSSFILIKSFPIAIHHIKSNIIPCEMNGNNVCFVIRNLNLGYVLWYEKSNFDSTGRIPVRPLTFSCVWPFRQLMARFSPIFGLRGLIGVNGAPFPLIRTSFSELFE